MVSPRAQGYAAAVRPSWLNLLWVSAILGVPSVASALTWSVSDPVPSPPPDTLAQIAQDWLAGEATPPWSRPVEGPIDARAVTDAGPGGTIYAASVFESTHAGAIAVRVRADAAFRVWLDGRLIGGVARAQPWTAAPIAVPAALEPGGHRLLVELRPAFARGALLAAAITTPAGGPIELTPASTAPVRPAAMPSAPVAIRAVDRPRAARPAQIWRPLTSAKRPPAPPITPPTSPDLATLRAWPYWPDADWELLWDAHHWVLDTRRRSRRVIGRVNSIEGVPMARAFLSRFSEISVIEPDGARAANLDEVRVGAVFMATENGALPADPLALGAARLRPTPAPTWRLVVIVEAPRDWTLARQARGLGGARIVDDSPGRRRWRYQADAVARGEGTLRVSRADGAEEFAQRARVALGDHLRPYPGQPTCADAQQAAPLVRAITCARHDADLIFARAAGRPPLAGPVDLGDFDAIVQAMPSWAAVGMRLDGTVERGAGIVERRVELTPDQPEPPRFTPGGPCGAGPVASSGSTQTRVEVRLVGVRRDPPVARHVTAGPLSHSRHVERTATGWRVLHRLSWTDLSGVTPARIAAACRALARP